MMSLVRDRAALLVVSVGVVLCSLVVGYVSDALGFGVLGLVFAMHAVGVFGGVLWYCSNAWPRWYRRKLLRSRIAVTYLALFVLHWLIIASLFHRLRFDWNGWVWGALGLAEMFVIVVLITAVVVRAEEGSAI